MKRNRLELSQARRALTAYDAIPIRFIDADLALSIEAADEYDLYAHDAHLIVCALQQRAPLVTLDATLMSNIGPTKIWRTVVSLTLQPPSITVLQHTS